MRRWAAIGAAVVGLELWPRLLPPPPPLPPGAETGKDVLLYGSVRDRLADGEAYYRVLGEELVRNGFRTWPVFHWRTPLVLELDAHLPWPVGPQILYLALVAAAAAAAALGPADRRLGIACAALIAVGLAPLGAAPQGLLFAETWAGAALALSAAGFLIERPWLRVGAGALALALRELAAPWCVLGLLDAARRRRWGEAGAWAAVLAGYAALYAVHVDLVLAWLPPDPEARGWLGFGGAGFALGCLRWFAPVALVPALGPLVIGAAAAALTERTPGVRVVAAGALGYLALFAVVALPFDDYWGCLLVGLWGVATPYGVTAIALYARNARPG